MSAETLEYHHGKHHKTYVDNLNKLTEGSEKADMDLMDLIKLSKGNSEMVGIFNNAAQIWNHTFYWNTMGPQGKNAPNGKLKDLMERDFGSYEQFQETFVNAGATQFGSGYAWLVLNTKKDGKLEVLKTGNADLPTEEGIVPLMTCDVWEHAYYIDHRNRRPDYLKVFLNELVNWEFAEENLRSV